MICAVPAEALLTHWEDGPGRTPAGRALALLAALAGPSAPHREPWSRWDHDPGRWSLGQRDVALLHLHTATFGRSLEAVTECPACGDQLELELDTALLTGTGAEPSGTLPGIAPAPPQDPAAQTVRAHGHVVRCRPPRAADVAAAAERAASAPGPGSRRAAADALFCSCVESAAHHGEPIAPDRLPPTVREAVEAALEAADPAAETRLRLTCPACGHRWGAVLDPAGFVCAELDRAAVALAGEVHALAREYGWAERDILAMRPARRRLYLEVAR